MLPNGKGWSSPCCLIYMTINRTILCCVLWLALTWYPGHAQPATVGLIKNEGIDEGFILFAPLNHKVTYLIDRQGRLVNAWESTYVPGLTAYLDDDGSLFRAGRVTDATYINSGGAGGIIEKFDWKGNLLWEYRYADTSGRQHHDFELLPGGHLLLIAWEEKSAAEAIAAGRDPETMGTDKLWPDHLVEIKPQAFNEGEIVWRWSVWDHLIQEHDAGKSNFGVVAEHPELIDINYRENNSADWIHGNALAYHPVLDQIAFSSRAFNEIWIIDHSTSMTEAASHSGGNSGYGGDLLFRWGNPTTYQVNGSVPQQLFGQHGLEWIFKGEDPGKLMVFNNGNKRPGNNFASIEIIDLALDEQGNYLQEGGFFLPERPLHSFTSRDTTEMFAPLFSNVQSVANEHLLLCVGPRGTFLQYDPAGNLVWKYISPVLENGTVLHQGETIGDQFSSNNSVFSIAYYATDFSGFSGRIYLQASPSKEKGS